MYAEPNATREKDATFYRKRYLQGALSLNLNKDLAKGDYVVIPQKSHSWPMMPSGCESLTGQEAGPTVRAHPK
jgi:hypothetical protein